MARIDVKRQIEAVLRKTGLWGQWKDLAAELNKQRITTPQGKQWKSFNLYRYCERTWPESITRDEPERVPQESTLAHDEPQTRLFDESTQENTETSEDERQDGPEGIPTYEPERVPQGPTLTDRLSRETRAHDEPHLDPNDLEDMQELLTWWRERKGELTTAHTVPQEMTPTERPIFKGPREATKTVRMSEALAKAAVRYAKKHRAQTGGTFSEMVEWLIWRELGCEERFIESVLEEHAENTE